MLIQIMMLVLVAIGLIIYIYRFRIIMQCYKKTGNLPAGRHSISNLIFAVLAFVLLVLIWNNLSWEWYVLPLFAAALMLKLWIDYYYTPAQLFMSGRQVETAA